MMFEMLMFVRGELKTFHPITYCFAPISHVCVVHMADVEGVKPLRKGELRIYLSLKITHSTVRVSS